MEKYPQNDNNYAIAYYRYSSAGQNEASIDQQREAAQEYAEKHDFEIIREYSDSAYSGTTDKRPGFQLMLAEVKKLKPAALILWKTDRFARNVKLSQIEKYEVRKAGCKIHYIAENTPDGSPEDTFMEHMMEAWAEYSSLQLGVNVTRGMTYNAKRGLYNGVKITGYTVDKNKHYIIDEKTAPIIKKVFESYAAGKPIISICDELNNAGIRTAQGNEFKPNSMAAILRNKAYIGVYKFGDYVIEDCLPPIISKELFDQVQKRLVYNKRFGSSNHKGRTENDSPRFWLSGKLYCGYCGDNMQGSSGTSKSGKTYYYYACNTQRNKRKHKEPCYKKQIRKEELESMVSYLIENTVLSNSTFRSEVAAQIAMSLESMKDNNKEVIKVIESDLKQNKKAIDNVMKAIINGAYGESINKQLEELENKKKQLENALSIEKAKEELACNENEIQEFFNKYVNSGLMQNGSPFRAARLFCTMFCFHEC